MQPDRVARSAPSDKVDLPVDFTALVREYERPLAVFLTQMLDDAESARDLLQDTFCEAWKAFGRGIAPFNAGSDRDDVRHWLFHVAYHRAISALRRKRLIRWRSLEHEHAPDLFALSDAPDFEDSLADRDLLDSALAHLSSEDVACLVLTIIQGFTAAETAQIMKASPGAVAKRISRARRRLHAAYVAEYARMQEDERR
jgi:RNA polymerase sigma factor (sigma-70 family)